MVQATKFLLRWLYLNNLIRDRAEIQLLPHIQQQHHGDYQHHPYQESGSYEGHSVDPSYDYAQVGAREQRHESGHQSQNPTSDHQAYTHQSPPQPLPPSSSFPQQSNYDERIPNAISQEEEWKRKALLAIAQYPPGSSRLLALDSLRLEIVHEFARELYDADCTISNSCKSSHFLRKRNQGIMEDEQKQRYDIEAQNGDTSKQDKGQSHDKSESDEQSTNETSIEYVESDQSSSDEEDDPFLDDDLRIIQAFQEATSRDLENDIGLESITEEPAVLVISPRRQTSTERYDEASTQSTSDEEKEEQEKLKQALALHRETRDYLPQLVSAVLHSPPPLTQPSLSTPHLDPLATLRRLLVTRCVRDPNLGIELCWLLEAEVGRAWKTLFEHRQQTGRRLIVVLPAEKAAVIAKIGTEKRSAFDLLQDAESSTAYGVMYGDDYGYQKESHPQYYNTQEQPTNEIKQESFGLYNTPRLPSSLSLRRCSHFGDTMHFIDRLTQMSLDLRLVPPMKRKTYLQQSLEELNRRIRRRMVTRGDVSLDVEDNRGSYDWPTLSDITQDVLKYSIHFPLEPECTVWPGSINHASMPHIDENKSKPGVMRVLNIVSGSCRILASRERCPFLVHCEVADTNYEGSDARLYASGAKSMGATIEEVMGMVSTAKMTNSDERTTSKTGFNSYRIPSELLLDASVRGGYQSYPEYPSPYDSVREEQLQQLHEQLQTQQNHPHFGPPPTPLNAQQDTTLNLSTYSTLLDKVFGLPWEEKCEQIRLTSPYGKVKGWRLASFIMKAGEDIRREALVMQVISKLKTWFDEEIPIAFRPYLRPYTIMCVGGDAGLLECVKDSKSIDEVKKETDGFTSLRDYFERAYGPPSRVTKPPHAHTRPPGYSTQQSSTQNSPLSNPAGEDMNRVMRKTISFEEAQDNFLRSLVGYSLVCYILQIKDRHNANILLDREGHIMHIDFGFVLGDTPKMGKVPLFSERAPFKLTVDFWEVIGGWNFRQGGLGVKFCKMFEEAFAVASSHVDEISTLIEAAILNLTRNPNVARSLANGVRDRLQMRGERNSVEQKTFIMDLVNTALTSWGTSTYDWLQKSMNGYI